MARPARGGPAHCRAELPLSDQWPALPTQAYQPFGELDSREVAYRELPERPPALDWPAWTDEATYTVTREVDL